MVSSAVTPDLPGILGRLGAFRAASFLFLL